MAAAKAEATGARTKAANVEKAAADVKRGTAYPRHLAQNEEQNQNDVDLELSVDGLPEGSTLSGNKAPMDDYSEDEANSKKTKKTNTSKGKKGNPKTKK